MKIDACNNLSFNSRFLRIPYPEQFPKEVLSAVKSNNAIDEFIKAGTPKTFIGKIIDLFKDKECLEVYYFFDKSYSLASLSFQLGFLRKNKSLFCKHQLDIRGVVDKNQPPTTAVPRIIKALNNIKDFNFITEKPYPQTINV